MGNKITIAILWAMGHCATAFAQTQFSGLTPGASARADVEKTLGRPVRQASGTVDEYQPKSGTGKIEVEYRAGSDVADRIELHFLTPITRSALTQKLDLTSPDSQKTNAEGKLVEYFTAPALALTYAAGDVESGVASIGYYGRTRFEDAAGRSQPGTPVPPPPILPRSPSPQPKPTDQISFAEFFKDANREPAPGARPTFGVLLQSLTPEIARQSGLPSVTTGALVRDLAPGSPAIRSGIRRGDVIQQIDNRTIRSTEDVQATIRSAGDQVRVLINRSGRTVSILVKLR